MSKPSRRKARVSTGAHTIGFEVVHPLQHRLAQRALAVLWANEKTTTRSRRSPIITLPPQGGKTGALTILIDLFIDDCIKRNRTFQVVVLCGLPHLDLTGQTRDRLTQRLDGKIRSGAMLDVKAMASRLTCYPNSQMREGIVIRHNSSKLRRFDLSAEVDVRLVVTDEVHLGNGRDGNIDLFLQHHGVTIRNQIHTWDNSKTVTHFVGVSATPAAHMLKCDNVDGLYGETLFTQVYETPPANYTSPKKMRNSGRLLQTEALFTDSGDPTRFLQDVERRFRDDCRKFGAGLLVLRAVGEKHEELMAYINRKGRKVEVEQFDADSKNLDKLNEFLSTKPSEPTYVIIRGSMRAGITLGKKNHIRGWVETESQASDTQVQAGVGRACGYNRNKDVYPIYCDLRHVDSWIAVYDALDSGLTPIIPSGVQNKAMQTRTRYDVKEIIPFDEAWQTYVYPYSREGCAERGVKYDPNGRKQISSTKDNVFNDVSGMLLEGRHDSGATVGIRVDGPVSDDAVGDYLKKATRAQLTKLWHEFGPGLSKDALAKHLINRNRASYEKLIRVFPEAVSEDPKAPMAIILDLRGRRVAEDGQSRNGLQKLHSGLKNIE